MFQLLKIEWLKLKNFRTFWIITGLFALFLPLFNYMISSGIMDFGPKEMLLLSYGFSGVWSNFNFWSSWFIIFIAFVIVILITNEYRYRTNRQNVLDGWSRLDFFNSKIILVLVLALITTIYSGIWCLIFGASYTGGFKNATDGMIKLVYLFILCVNYFGFAMMLSFLMKRSGLVIGIFMIYILMIENILRAYLNWQFKGTFIGNYLPLQSSDSLLPFPLIDMAEKIGAKGLKFPSPSTYVIVSVAYIILYYLISRRKLMKSDW